MEAEAERSRCSHHHPAVDVPEGLTADVLLIAERFAYSRNHIPQTNDGGPSEFCIGQRVFLSYTLCGDPFSSSSIHFKIYARIFCAFTVSPERRCLLVTANNKPGCYTTSI